MESRPDVTTLDPSTVADVKWLAEVRPQPGENLWATLFLMAQDRRQESKRN